MKPTVQIIRNHRKPKSASDPNKDRRTLELRVTYNRKILYYTTNGTIRLTEDEFKNNNLKIHKEAFEEIRPAYKAAIEIIDKLGDTFSFDLFYRDYRRMVHGELVSAYDVRSIFSEYISDTSHLRPLSEKSKVTYNTTLNWLVKFKDKLTIGEITTEVIAKFDMFLHKQRADISPNTISIYLRCIRAVYNYAVDKGYVEDKHPFKKYPLTSTRKVNYGLSLITTHHNGTGEIHVCQFAV